MTIDTSQFHTVFFEESFESLDVMEKELLNLNIGLADVNVINSIFRAAYSIKGGAATFGFVDISSFTHVLEAMLDEMRNGQRKVSVELKNVLLQTVDVIREMLTAVQNKLEIDEVRTTEIRQKLEAMMADVTFAADERESKRGDEKSNVGWIIDFRPHSQLFKTGNDPVRFFRELDSLGDLSVEVNDDNLPAFSDLEPEDSYLKWTLTLRGDIAESTVLAIFESGEADCDLVMTPLISDTEKLSTNEEQVVTTAEPASEPQQIPSETVSQIIDEKLTPTTSIRTSTDKVDALLNQANELSITQSMLSQIGENFTPEHLPLLRKGLAQLERNTREMREGIMQVRMLPISLVFNRFPRLVHDMSNAMGKKVELKLSGEHTEIDKAVIDKISAPMVHLVRNALDHGLEAPDIRFAAGKNETGILELKVFHQGNKLVIEVHDDGVGLDDAKILSKAIENGLVTEGDVLSSEKIHELIFEAGFSTADTVTDVSGRGVGMNVVRKNISSLNGTVEVQSKHGEGTVFTIRLPLTLAVIEGQTICVANEHYIIPLLSIIETVQIKSVDVKRIAANGELYRFGDEFLPVIRLYSVFNITPMITELEQGLLVIVEGEGEKYGLFIDDLLDEQHVVIKSLEMNYRKVTGISGGTILSDGTVGLVIDVPEVMALYRDPSLATTTSNNDRAA